VLADLQEAELFVYLDDIVLYSNSLNEHKIKFHKLAERLRKAGLRLQSDKCEFLRKEVVYLGHIIGENGVKPVLRPMDSEFSKISFLRPSTRPNERDKSGRVNRGTRAVSGITP